MRVYGTAAISDLLGDFVAYRGLRPVDTRLPGLAELGPALGLPPDQPPRKGDPAYARVVAELLRAARRIDAPNVTLKRMLLIGDTRSSDGGAFSSICAATGWEGRAFICDASPGAAPAIRREGNIAYANRWEAIYAWNAALEAEELPIDQALVVVLDLDKTLIGARGRNHQLIDGARLHALRTAVEELLGAGFAQSTFEATYAELNQSRYHPFTVDNQDYLAYICVMVGGGVFTLSELLEQISNGQVADFPAFIELAGQRVETSAPKLAAFHSEIARLVASGDPTPFKAFRRREYAETALRMGSQPDDTPVEQLVREELVLTAEVWEVARIWQRHGAMLFGLSDKPDEAAIPPEEAASRGALALHRMRTHIVGG